jgi:hypothetical protein
MPKVNGVIDGGQAAFRSSTFWSILLGGQLSLSVLRDRANSYNQPFKMMITKFDGITATVTRDPYRYWASGAARILRPLWLRLNAASPHRAVSLLANGLSRPLPAFATTAEITIIVR